MRLPGKIPEYLSCLVILTTAFSSAPAGENESITACKPVYEINVEWRSFRLRSHENAFLSCHISQSTFNTLINQALSDSASANIQYRSVFIGRLIEYPWLARQLAQYALQHSAWDPVTGQVAEGNLNQFVVSILSMPDLLQQIQEPFTEHGYRVTGVSVEKVLVENADKIPWLGIEGTERVPYDAMVHFTLEQQLIPEH